MTTYEFSCLIIALMACGVMIATYLYLRRPAITALDGFFFFFVLQYGPHTLFLSPIHRLGNEISRDTAPMFLIGMTVAYLLVSLGFMLGQLFDFTRLSRSSFPNLFGRGIPLIVLTALYIVPFAAVQGPGLDTTREYISGFLGQSQYSYVEIRRVIFAESPYEQLASLTRQTTTAVLFAYLVVYAIREPAIRLLCIPTAGVLFVMCGMQMNKFPFVYFFALTFIVGFTYWQQRQTGPMSAAKRAVIFSMFAIFAFTLIGTLYSLQYNNDEGYLSVGDIIEVSFYRLGLVSSDGLRLWFDFFPEIEPFTGFNNIGMIADAFGQAPVNPTIAIPERYVPNVLTTFQAGFVGSGYASFGFVGIGVSALIVGLFVAMISRLQWAFRFDRAAHPLLCVLTLNMFFFTTRELHTAALSGGTVSVLTLFLTIHFIAASVRR
ncbi:MAG: hypothetical protein IT423_16950 [Pirellulaceae bacterium]|nr:hypothetical protein [Pirellulaceae bacterium]